MSMSSVRGPQRGLAVPVAAEGAFDLMRAVEQVARRQPRLDRDAGIDESRLVGHAPGRRR